MDGSVAHATAVRIGQQLKNKLHANVAGTQQTLFEELLKVPITTSVQPVDDSVSQEAVAESPSSDGKSTDDKQGAGQVESSAKGEDEQESEADATASASLVAATMVVPVAQTDSGDDLPQADDTATLDSSQVELAGSSLDANTTVVEQAPVVASNTLEASAVANAPVVQMEEAPARVEPTPPVVTNNTETGSLAEQANVKVERKTQSSEVNAPAPVEASSDTLLDRADRTSDQADPLVAKLDNTSPEENQTAIAEDSAQNERTDSRNEREKWYLRDEAAGLAGDPSSGQPATGDTASDVKSEAPAEANTVSGNDLAAQMTAQLDPVQGPSAVLPAIDPSLIAGALANAQTTLAVAPPAAVSSSNAISAANNSAGSTTAIGSGTSSLGTAGTRSPDAQRAERAADERSEAGSVRQLSQQERVRLVQRVARSFSRLGPEGGQITLKLHPPQLGSLNVTVRIEGQVMSARLQTETSAAREVLLENLPVLRERLQEQGVSIERFQVDVANDQAGSFGGQAQNPFPGDGNQGSQPARTDIDYRRLSRNSSRPGGFERMAANERVAPVWLPSESSLTLDIRA